MKFALDHKSSKRFKKMVLRLPIVFTVIIIALFCDIHLQTGPCKSELFSECEI